MGHLLRYRLLTVGLIHQVSTHNHTRLIKIQPMSTVNSSTNDPQEEQLAGTTSKYSVPDGHWDDKEEARPEEAGTEEAQAEGEATPSDTDGRSHSTEATSWREDTSARDISIDVQIHREGYQTDERWTIHCLNSSGSNSMIAVYGVEQQNKGNYWRPGDDRKDAVDFEALPKVVQQRTAAVLNRTVREIQPGFSVIDSEKETDSDTHTT